MKKFFLITVLFSLVLTPVYAQTAGTVPVNPEQSLSPAGNNISSKAKIILLISEQNIDSPRSAWWAGEVDLSATEAALAKQLLDAGFEILEPDVVGDIIKKDKAFRMVTMSDQSSVKLANMARADYAVVGKAVASAGGNVPHSSMRSCFANLTAKVINVKTGKIIAYLDASGNSAHMDVISGGREALVNAGGQIAGKIIEKLNSAPGGIAR